MEINRLLRLLGVVLIACYCAYVVFLLYSNTARSQNDFKVCYSAARAYQYDLNPYRTRVVPDKPFQ
ncbi:MAG TPA: hypothetical protein P5287_05465, partial [bacterium]|nr:hypothetical protein [bacterium]